jgi:hypothetical protein
MEPDVLRLWPVSVTKRQVQQRLTWRAARVGVPVAIVLSLAVADPALGAVSVSVASVNGSNLRMEGTATASRDITVDGVVRGRSDTGGKFKIAVASYTPPADCTVDVNDGSATARVATLSGCTVRTTPPPPSGPAAPAPSGPANGASVTSPVTLSWSQVLDPSSLNGGYNWEISASSTFSPLVTRSSTAPSVTQQQVGGLAPGTYFWRVQAVNAAMEISAWSPVRSFVVTGAGAGAIGAPVLDVLPFGTAYHPWESFPFTWSAVPGAASYVVEADKDARFPAPVAIRFDNIRDTRYGLTLHQDLIGSWNLRVYAVDANGVAGPVSNVRPFTISYTAPVGPAPTLVSPANGASQALPIMLDWNDVANPQPSGYDAQVSSDPSFTNIETQITGQTGSQYELLSLPPGTHYWRVLHNQGLASATTNATTAWSEVRSFTIPSTPAAMSSLWLGGPPCSNPCPGTESLFSGQEIVVSVQLTAPAPAGGAEVIITTSDKAASGTHPASVTVPAGVAFAQFRLIAGQVSERTPVTLTGTLGSSSASAVFAVDPPSLKSLSLPSKTVTGGSPADALLSLNGLAPPAGATVTMSSSSPLAVVPATATVPAGLPTHFVTIDTSPVDAPTPVTITATWKGVTFSAQLTLTPGVPPETFTLDPVTVTGGQSSSGRVSIAALQDVDTRFNLTSSNPAVARVPATVTIPAGSPHAAILVQTGFPSTATTVTLTVSGGGVTKTTTLTVQPFPTAPLPAPTLLTPANGTRFTPTQSVAFDWNDVGSAATYTLQVSSSSTFSSLVLERTVSASQVAATFPATGDRFWRVRANDAGANPGAWSAVRSFRVK